MHHVRRLIFLAMLLGSHLTNAEAATVNLSFLQFAEADGSLTYGASIRIGFGPAPGPTARLIAPDGTIVAWNAGTLRLDGLSYETLTSRFVGQWTIQENAPNTGVDTFVLNALPVLPVPFVTSPSAGDIVGTMFDTTWAFAAGEGMPGPALSVSNVNSLPVTFGPTDGSLRRTIMIDLAGESSVLVDIRGGGASAIQDYLSDLSFVPWPNGSNLSIVGFYGTFSAPVTVRVVPEPASLTLVMAGGLAVATIRRRRI